MLPDMLSDTHSVFTDGTVLLGFVGVVCWTAGASEIHVCVVELQSGVAPSVQSEFVVHAAACVVEI